MSTERRQRQASASAPASAWPPFARSGSGRRPGRLERRFRVRRTARPRIFGVAFARMARDASPPPGHRGSLRDGSATTASVGAMVPLTWNDPKVMRHAATGDAGLAPRRPRPQLPRPAAGARIVTGIRAMVPLTLERPERPRYDLARRARATCDRRPRPRARRRPERPGPIPAPPDLASPFADPDVEPLAVDRHAPGSSGSVTRTPFTVTPPPAIIRRASPRDEKTPASAEQHGHPRSATSPGSNSKPAARRVQPRRGSSGSSIGPAAKRASESAIAWCRGRLAVRPHGDVARQRPLRCSPLGRAHGLRAPRSRRGRTR